MKKKKCAAAELLLANDAAMHHFWRREEEEEEKTKGHRWGLDYLDHLSVSPRVDALIFVIDFFRFRSYVNSAFEKILLKNWSTRLAIYDPEKITR